MSLLLRRHWSAEQITSIPVQPRPGMGVSRADREAFGRDVQVGAFPIGIDSDDFARMMKSNRARRMRDLMTACTVFRHLIVGVDRLDYSKGLEERFLGFERLLIENPDLRREVLMLQIAPVSRESVEAYQEIREDGHPVVIMTGRA